MAQTRWSGLLSFGLVNIPVDLRTAETPDSLDLDLLDRRDLAPVGYKPYNKKTDENVESADIVKGYEISDGKYVLVEKEDLKRANVKSTQTIEIVEFVDLKDIDSKTIRSGTGSSRGSSRRESTAAARSCSGIAESGSRRGTSRPACARGTSASS